MKAEYRTDINTASLMIETDGIYREDYQMQMLRRNQIDGILKVNGKGIDDKSQYVYDISGKISMKAMFSRNHMSGKDMYQFTRQLAAIINKLRHYMLDAEHLILIPEYIFYSRQQYYFCYYPAEKEKLCTAFHKLTEYFVNQTDYGDKEGIVTAYELHKASMEENYSLDLIMDRLTKPPEQSKIDNEVRQPENTQEEVVYKEPIAKGIKEMNDGNQIFGKLKRKARQRKKAKWGDWEALLIDEEQGKL